MNSQWQRRRQPDDVPTPVAVAVSDFCRRAKSIASPTEVREALALLSEDEDFRVRTLTDTEPEVSPLGPFAVVDILRGTAASLAAQRQGCGYYELVQELARVREEKTPLAPAPTAPAVPTFAAPTPRPAPAGDAEEVGRGKAARRATESVQERIAPRKRATAAESEVEQEEAVEAEPRFLKRDLPKPRGRFTQVAAPKGSYQVLLRAEGKDILTSALGQNEHRFSLLKSLAEQYNGAKGGDLAQVDLESALRRHELLETMTAKERQAVLSAYTDQRGATGRVGWALGLSPSELQRLVESLGLQTEVEEVRERFRREALGARHLTQRLDLLGRDKYLTDLGIKKRFTETLRKELEGLVRDELSGARDLPGLALAVARKHGAPQELVLRAIERLGLAGALRGQLSANPDFSSP